MKRDESKLADLLPKTGRNIADRKLSLSEIIKDIYGSRVANFYEYGIVEAIDPDDFSGKLDSLEDRWKSLWGRQLLPVSEIPEISGGKPWVALLE